MRSVVELLELTGRLDARYHLLQDGVERDKEQTLIALGRVLAAARTKYAIIGGVAVQFRSRDPRTTLDIDVAVLCYDDLPHQAFLASGFNHLKRHAHPDNWTGPDGTPVQFTDDPVLHTAVSSAEEHRRGKLVLRIATSFELVRAKLRAAKDPARRRSKRLIDLAGACALVEEDSQLRDRLAPEELAQIDRAGD